jgi:hypothetical protein
MNTNKSNRLSHLAGILGLFAAGVSPAEVVTLQPLDDSTIGTHYPDTPADVGGFILEGWVSGYIHRPMLKFDLSSIPAGATLISAQLTVLHNVFSGNSAPTFRTEVWRLANDSWTEETITWNSCDHTGAVEVAIRQAQPERWDVIEPWVWNVRLEDWDHAADLLDDTVTFQLRWGDENNQWWKFTGFSSKEGPTAPQLRIEYTMEPPPPPILSIALNDEQITVSWPALAEGWLLERSTQPDAGTWTQIPPPYLSADGNWFVTLPRTGAPSAEFFRLHKP